MKYEADKYPVFVSSGQVSAFVRFWQNNEAAKNVSQAVLFTIVQTATLME
jgi:hypothetical protein